MFIGLCTESVDVEPMFRESVLLPISDSVSLSCNLFATFFGVIMYRNGTCHTTYMSKADSTFNNAST